MAQKNDCPRDPLDVLKALLVELNLTTLARDLPGVLAQAEQAAPGYSDFLRRALEVEQTARTERRIQRRVRWSRLGPHVSLDDFDFAARPQLSPQAVKELLTCRFVEERRNIVLVGKPSLGKTTVARAIGHEACKRGFSVYSMVVCARHRQRSTVVVTNLSFKRWGEFMPSPAQAVAIADRLIDQATILRFSGKPFRTPRDIFGAPLEDE